MRTISKFRIWTIRLGSRFTRFSAVVALIGFITLAYAVARDITALPAVVAILLTGLMLMAVSIVRANKKIRLIQTGLQTKGSFKGWSNSFITFNNSNLVFLVYTYRDRKRKQKEASVLSTSTDGLPEVTVFYDEADSVILEYLPGKPGINEKNEIR
ncbi:hypothetical protein [Paenibacillus glycinis]|uniref:Uncharacterized protein n=1 Tax=Paenibacillus glycinis TaxID=2697035 RepID=A0ABW9XRW2_9BACL|nr:hypothetical protein [Paenibacillus glycinis]NBD25400.1 hypothetical protein [Paenibacillus glycinis]